MMKILGLPAVVWLVVLVEIILDAVIIYVL